MGRFSPRVQELRFDGAQGFFVDLSGTEKLLGSAETIVGKLQRQAGAMGIAASVAASCNFHAGLCWAKAYPGTTVIAPGQERKSLARIPIDVLELTLEQSVTFSLWGVHTLGDVAALPLTELVARMGQEGKRLHQLARGEHAHLLNPVAEEFTLREEMEFEAGVESLDSVMFVLNTMLEQLSLRAQSRALAMASVTVVCKLEGGGCHERSIRPVLPTIDHAALLKLIHLDLIANPPNAEVVGIVVTAQPNRPSRAQLGLFSPQFPEPMRLEVTLARLASVVGGEDRVGAPELLDSNQRDAFRLRHFAAPEETKSHRVATVSRIGVRILRPPEPVYVQVENARPSQFVFRSEQYQVVECYGPWHDSGAWWDTAPSTTADVLESPGSAKWERVQWDVVASSRAGRALCCLLSCAVEQWEVAGVYD